MSRAPARDLLVGLFVLAGLGAVAYLSFSVGGVSYGGPARMGLYADFDEIGSLKPRAQVVIAGVKVGQVGRLKNVEHLFVVTDRPVELPVAA